MDYKCGFKKDQQDFLLPPICTAFTEDAESGAPGWTFEGAWAIQNTSAHGGTMGFTDSPDGDYGSNQNLALISPTLDLSTDSNIQLTFWHHYVLESSWDYGYVEYSLDGATNWTELARFTGTQIGWKRETLDLSALDGTTTGQVRFRLNTDNNTDEDGWYLDDIELITANGDCAPLTLARLLTNWPEQYNVSDLVAFLTM